MARAYALGRVRVKGTTYAWSLRTDEVEVATQRYAAHKRRLIAEAYYGELERDPTKGSPRLPDIGTAHAKTPGARAAVSSDYPPSKRERGGIKEAVEILAPLKPRTIKDMAAAGELPGAAKLQRRWSFNLPLLRDYVKQKEQELSEQASERRRRIASGMVMRAGASRAGRPSTGRLGQMMRELRASVAKLRNDD